MIRSIFLFLTFSVVLGGCAHRVSNLSLVSPDIETGSVQEVLVVTNRMRDENSNVRFNGERSEELSFVDAGIWVPDNREAGEIRYPYGRIDPGKHFAAVSFEEFETKQDFLDRLNTKLLAIETPADRRVVVFVHGYNVDFGEGLLRHAQIGEDFGISGAAVHFSWPSAGEITQYLYDRDSAHFSRDGMSEMLELVTQSDADSILIFAHSMGTFLTMETLRELSLNQRTDILEKIDQLILASPDIDVDVFRSQIASLSPLPNIVTFVSKNDLALSFSERLRGGSDRVGRGARIMDLQALGVTVIDLTQINDSFTTAHNAFAESPTLLSLIRSGELTAFLDGANEDEEREEGIGAMDTMEALSGLVANIVFLPIRIMGDQ